MILPCRSADKDGGTGSKLTMELSGNGLLRESYVNLILPPWNYFMLDRDQIILVSISPHKSKIEAMQEHVLISTQ